MCQMLKMSVGLISIRLLNQFWAYNCKKYPGCCGVMMMCSSQLDSLDNYYASGFLQLQTWLDNFILQKETKNNASTITAAALSFHLPASTSDNMAAYLSGFFSFIVIMPFVVPFLRLVYLFVNEKVIYQQSCLVIECRRREWRRLWEWWGCHYLHIIRLGQYS